ncbi:cell division protein FtsA [Wolbachia endosymbiont of Dirofilaria (Dirofilaria) immitis]|uniref:cell division protein FtsA n=1 Tax=Wolbachia endosymbiont of Dirofilaria (Dirofilaria) immitis TaxID=1812115 RepID=UPI00158CC3C4|nr:cell division protein FtsA [Wolbachia endosymbiont of Dirofilaria (Dirofilaria) immitis]QKX02122.1 cell division protein FtsA [Wolbachia endosymbiont of Dirofilaria (Dirofilaria) immitis]
MYSAVIVKPKRNIFAVLDIGTTKIICLIVEISGNLSYKITGTGYKIAEGINGGSVIDIKHASHSISSTIGLAEQISEKTIDQIYMNVAGCGISSFNMHNEIIVANYEISDLDIKRVVFQTFEKYIEGNVIIHNIPLKYHLDDMTDIKEVSGLYGKRLSADVNVVTASRPALINIENCIINNDGISIAGCVASAYSASFACLSEDEKELGTAIVDIGGGYTAVGIFKRGKLIYASSIPIGGIHITKDIAYGLCTNIEYAERIKILHGNTIVTSIDENEYITVQNSENDESIPVPKYKLINIIRPRVEEILELVKEQLQKQKDPINKVVITGGTSQLTSMKEIASYIFNKQVRIGHPDPESCSGLESEYNKNPVFSAAIGSIKLIIDTFYKNNPGMLDHDSKIGKLYNWVKSKIIAR